MTPAGIKSSTLLFVLASFVVFCCATCVRSFTHPPTSSSSSVRHGRDVSVVRPSSMTIIRPSRDDGGGYHPRCGVLKWRDHHRRRRVPPLAMAASVVPGGGSTKSSYSNNDDDDDDDDDAEEEGKEDRPPYSDGEALQSLFSRHCDPDGLMTREDVRGVPEIAAMLERGDLLPSELDDVWNVAPKFPQAEVGTTTTTAVVEDRIDVDGFIQIYRDIDDMFEDDDNDDDDEGRGGSAVVLPDDDDDEANRNDDGEDDELRGIFDALLAEDGGINGKDDAISPTRLRRWEEVSSLIEGGTLGEDEFEALVGGAGRLDYGGFVRFNRALDGLFEFEDDDENESDDGESYDGDDDDGEGAVDRGGDDDAAQAKMAPPPTIVMGEDLPPGVLFSRLANENYLVGRAELRMWGELSDMLKEGELTTSELDALFDAAVKAPGTRDMLDEDGFCALYGRIDDLFENDEVVEEGGVGGNSDERELKEELLELLGDIAKVSAEEGRLLCGLDSTELEQERVLEVVNELEREPYNQVVSSRSGGGSGTSKEELIGLWDLIYSSSSTMKYNEGLSGLAGGLTRFGGLQQSLSATKYLSDVEYTEQVINKLGGKSFEVKVTGDWDLRTEISLFTGKPSDVLSITPDKVSYGPRSDKADHWKSLGPMNLLVLSYLDEDLRIMRGNTSTDTLFIWRRSK